MLQVINSGDLDKVSEQIIRWDKVGKKAVAGLTRRRKAEAQLFDDAVYDHKPKESKPKAKAKFLMDEHGKDLMDVAAASTGILSLAAWLPPTASLFTIIWLGLRIYESKTIQDLINKK